MAAGGKSLSDAAMGRTEEEERDLEERDRRRGDEDRGRGTSEDPDWWYLPRRESANNMGSTTNMEVKMEATNGQNMQVAGHGSAGERGGRNPTTAIQLHAEHNATVVRGNNNADRSNEDTLQANGGAANSNQSGLNVGAVKSRHTSDSVILQGSDFRSKCVSGGTPCLTLTPSGDVDLEDPFQDDVEDPFTDAVIKDRLRKTLSADAPVAERQGGVAGRRNRAYTEGDRLALSLNAGVLNAAAGQPTSEAGRRNRAYSSGSRKNGKGLVYNIEDRLTLSLNAGALNPVGHSDAESGRRNRAYSTGNRKNCKGLLAIPTPSYLSPSTRRSANDSDGGAYRSRAHTVGSVSHIKLSRRGRGESRSMEELRGSADNVPTVYTDYNLQPKSPRLFTASSLHDLMPHEADSDLPGSFGLDLGSTTGSRTSLTSGGSGTSRRSKCCVSVEGDGAVGAEDIELEVTEKEEDLPKDVLPPTSIHPMAEDIRSFKLWTPHIEGESWWYVVRMVVSIIAHVFSISLGLSMLILARDTDKHSSALILCTLLFLFCYVICLVEALFAKELKYLREVWNTPDAKSYIHKLHTALPIVIFKVTCYHHVTKYKKEPILVGRKVEFRQVAYRDREISHKEQSRFSFLPQNVIEMSPLDVDFKQKKTIRINYFRTMSFATEEARTTFSLQLEALRAKHRKRDKHISFAVDFRLPGFEPRQVCFVDKKYRRWIYRPWLYVLASFLLLSWPHRCWFRFHCGHTDFTFSKQFK